MKPLKIIALFILVTFVVLFLANLFFEYTQERLVLNEETRKELPGSFVKLQQGVTHYERTGPDTGKVMVLIHGGGNASYIWDKNVSFLIENGFHVLRYDLYGRGYSDRPAVDYDLTLFHNQLNELLDNLHLKQPVTLVGGSMGAMIAIDFAVKHPERVENLVLIDPAALNATQTFPLLKVPLLSDLYIAGYYYPKMINKQMHEFYNPNKVKEYAEKCTPQMQYKGFKNAIKSTRLHTLNINMEKEINQIGKNHVHTLLLWGKNDPLVDYHVSKTYLKAIPNIRYVEVDSAGHIANYEQPEVVNQAIVAFMKSGKYLVQMSK